jgi:hypothetical protein
MYNRKVKGEGLVEGWRVEDRLKVHIFFIFYFFFFFFFNSIQFHFNPSPPFTPSPFCHGHKYYDVNIFIVIYLDKI